MTDLTSQQKYSYVLGQLGSLVEEQKMIVERLKKLWIQK